MAAAEGGIVGTLAGIAGTAGHRDGPLGQSLLASPAGLALLADGRLVGLRNRRYGRTVLALYVNRPSGRLDMQPFSEEFVLQPKWEKKQARRAHSTSCG